jgi:hypothetical protein
MGLMLGMAASKLGSMDPEVSNPPPPSPSIPLS